MARTPKESRISTRESRLKLKPQKEPFWRQVVPGTFVGYAKGKRSVAWIARQRDDSGGYSQQRIGTPDDHAEADGDVILTYAQAVQRATAIQVEKRMPLPRHLGDGWTVNRAIEHYLEHRLAGRGSESVTRGFWRRHIKDGIGKHLVSSLRAEDIRTWHRGLAAKLPTSRGKARDVDMADQQVQRRRRETANRVLTIIKAALTYAWANDKLGRATPEWKKVEPFGKKDMADKEAPRMLTEAEITRLLEVSPPDLRDLLTAALMTGARFGELARLKVSDFDAEGRKVRLHQTKTGKVLLQPLTAEGARFFSSVAADRPAGDALLRRADGSAWSRHYQNRPMAAAAAAAGLEGVTFKVTRATYGKLLLLATRDLELVARALGHSDSRITRQHYAATLPSDVERGVASLPELGIAP